MSTPVLAPNSTWFRPSNTSITRSSITEINIVNSYTPTGSETASWDASAANDGSVMCYVNGTKLTIAGNGSGVVYANPDSSLAFGSKTSDRFTNLKAIKNASLFDTSKVTSMQQMFQFCSSLETLDVSTWNTSNVTTMYGVFQICTSLETLDLSNWNTEKVINMKGMFQSISAYGPMKLKTIGDISGWNTGKVENMEAMFQLCSSLEILNVSNWNVSSVQNMNNMFYNCGELTSIGSTTNWDVSKVTTIQQMFNGCTSLEELDVSNWDVSKVKNFRNMFSCGNDYGKTPMKIKTLDVSNWDTSSATDMSFTFYGCQGPGSIDVSGWDVSKVTTFDHMFAHSYLTIGDTSNWKPAAVTNLNGLFHTVQNTSLNVSGFNTSKVTIFDQMFERCDKLTEIIGLENFDTSNGLGFKEMFNGCSSLPELNLSSFDTRKAKDGATSSDNGNLTATLKDMFLGMTKLERITLGEKFSFNGDGTCAAENVGVLPTPNRTYIPHAVGGVWYNTSASQVFTPAEVPSKVADTYVVRALPILAASDTWFTQGGTSVKRSSITEIQIKDSYTPSGTVTASWDASAAKNKTVMAYVEGTKLTLAGNGSGKIYMNADSSYAFSSTSSDCFSNVTKIINANLLDASNVTNLNRTFKLCKKLTDLDISEWNTSKVEIMTGTFDRCLVLTQLDISDWDTSSVTDMLAMFQCCLSLESLDLSKWNVSKVENMQGMFMGHDSIGYMKLTSIGDVSGWDTSSCKSMRAMFQMCSSLETLDVSKWDTSSVETMQDMFLRCSSLEKLDVSNWDVSKVKCMDGMFLGSEQNTGAGKLKNLDVSKWDTSSCTDMGFMFYGQGALETVDVSNWNVSNVKTFSHMFADCYNLNSIDMTKWNTSSAESFDCMFNDCHSLTSVDVSGLETSACKEFSQMFENCKNLETIIGLENFNTSNGQAFFEMFKGCSKIKTLNLSSFDTSKANDTYETNNGDTGMAMTNMFSGMTKLERITLGEKFSFNGDGTTTVPENVAVLPTPDGAYIPGADGYWYTQHREKYLPADIQSQTAMTYYASLTIVNNIDFLVKNGSLLNIADKIRVLKDISQSMSLDDMEAQLDIPKNDSSDLTASGATVTVPIGYYAAQATKSIPTATQATPSISIDSAGKITASATQTAGYVSAGTKTSTHQLAFQPAKTITPTTASQIAVSSGYYTGGNVTVAGDSNLLAENIKSGVSIFGVSGNYVGGGGGGEVTPPTTPTDGKTRVYIHLEYGRTSPMLGVCPKGTVTVDWGDGTKPDTLTGTSTTTVKWTPTHKYTAPGDYVIALTVKGTMGFYGNSSSNQHSGILRYASGADTRNQAYQNAVQKVEIGEGVTSIDSYAFCYCSSLASITISEGVTSIGDNAFVRCSSLASITISEGVTSIGDNAFLYCSSLASITIPKSVTSIGDGAFHNCSSLASITIPEGVTSISSNAFYNCSSLASITIPKSVKSIRDSAFYFCSSLASVTISEGVKSIDTYAFYNCSSLASITISEGVTSISSNAFNSCSSLASITIPESVKSIGRNTFDSCYGMRYYDFTACTSVPTLSSANAFNNISSDCQMLIPAAMYDEWSAATNWATYAKYMVAV